MERRRGKAIRAARLAARLSQKALGERLGIRGQTIRRWEWEDTSPSRTKRTALVAAIAALNPEAARELARALDADPRSVLAEAGAAQSPSATTSELPMIDVAIFNMSDELDVAPRRIRSSVLELFRRMRAANLSIEVAERLLEERIASSQVDARGTARERDFD